MSEARGRNVYWSPTDMESVRMPCVVIAPLLKWFNRYVYAVLVYQTSYAMPAITHFEVFKATQDEANAYAFDVACDMSKVYKT